MDFISYLDSNDEQIFVGLVYIFAKQIKSARASVVEYPQTFRCTVADTPKVKMVMTAEAPYNTEIVFRCEPVGRSFELVGKVVPLSEMGNESSEPSRIIGNHAFYYLCEHSRLIRHRDYDDESSRKNHFKCEKDESKAIAAFDREVLSEQTRLTKWWEKISETEIVARLATI